MKEIYFISPEMGGRIYMSLVQFEVRRKVSDIPSYPLLYDLLMMVTVYVSLSCLLLSLAQSG